MLKIRHGAIKSLIFSTILRQMARRVKRGVTDRQFVGGGSLLVLVLGQLAVLNITNWAVKYATYEDNFFMFSWAKQIF